MTDLITTDSKSKNLSVSKAGQLAPVKSKLPARAASGAVTLVGVGLFAVGSWIWGGVMMAAGALWFLGTWLSKSQTALPATSSVIQDPAIKEAKRVIAKARFLEHIDKEGESAEAQAEGMITRWKTFEKLIMSKFAVNELTFQRYWDTAEGTMRAHFENLRMLADQLTQLSLARSTGGSLGPELELAVRERLDLGEKTLASFDRLSSELAKLETNVLQSTEYLDGAMKELQELANRAQKYSHTNLSKLE